MNIKILFTGCAMIIIGAHLYALDMVIHNNSGLSCRIGIFDDQERLQGASFILLPGTVKQESLAVGHYTLAVIATDQIHYLVEHDLSQETRDVYILPSVELPIAEDNEVAQQDDNEVAA